MKINHKLRHLFLKVKKSNFFKSVVKLFTGTAIGQIIGILLAPVLYRLYDPESFGVFAVFIGISSVLGTFSTFQYVQLILLEKENKSAINVLWLCRIINVAFCSLLFIVLVAISPYINTLSSNEILIKWLFLVPLIVFLTGQNEIYCIWANRLKEYNTLVLNGIIIAIVTPVASITLAFILKNETGLFIGFLLGQISSLIVLTYSLNNKYKFNLSTIHFNLIKKILVNNRTFPMFLMPTEIIRRLNSEMPIFLINSFFGSGPVGFYSLSVKILEVPLRFIGNAIGSVFRQKASEDYNKLGTCKESFLKTTMLLLFISAFPAIIIGLFAPNIFSFIFGENWITAGTYSQLLIPMIFFKLIVSPVSYVYYIYKKLKEDFFIHLYMLTSSGLILYLFFSNQALLLGILFFACNYAFIYIYTWLRSYKFTLNKITR